MTVRLLIFEPVFRRIEAQLADVRDRLELVLADSAGAIGCGGEALDALSAQPDIGWVSAGTFRTPVREAFREALLKSTRLKWVQSATAGFDNPLFGQLARRGVRLTNSHGHAVGMADTVLHGVLDHFQRGPERRESQAACSWRPTPFRELMQTRWLVIGFGAIGQAVAQRARAFGADVTGVRRSQASHPLADRIVSLANAPRLLPATDVVVLCAPLTPETRNLADAAFLAAMKPGAALVNVGRGRLVDEAALVAALDRGTPAHAVLDVFHTEPLPEGSPLWTHPRVSLTPHASGISDGVAARNEALFVDNLHRYLSGEPLINEVGPDEVLRAHD